MKKKVYSAYYMLLVVVLILTIPAMILCYYTNSPNIAAVITVAMMVSGMALGAMPDRDKYRSV